MPYRCAWLLAFILLTSVAAPVAPPSFVQQLEEDWLLQARLDAHRPAGEITTQHDAAGGCNGVKTGKWAFHTARERDPWWQVDLGGAQVLDRVALWNRCDDAAGRADRISLLLSNDGDAWSVAYTHDGPTFYGATDGKPLSIPLDGRAARFVRVQVPGEEFLHLDEVEVFGRANPEVNLALHRPADQSSVSPWSSDNRALDATRWSELTDRSLAYARRLIGERVAEGVDVGAAAEALRRLEAADPPDAADVAACTGRFLEARRIQRRLMLANPLLDFDTLLFAKRVPGSYSHMSDQYYGWWSRPGGGLYLMRGFREDAPELACITDAFTEPGSFLRPTLSFDGSKVLFAWCRHYPNLAAEPDKLNKDNVPEDAFYHVFEMNLDGSGLRQLTRGKYDDFDARYLPDGRIVFLSTRRGQFVQCGRESAAATTATPDLPDVYVRCGGGPERPVAVYTLHTMDADGSNLCAISPFEMFEWTPSVAHDGSIVYSRWDYVDRDNMPYMSLWAINPDGANARLVYGNFTHSPHCTFEPRAIPGSNKLVFTASGHHAQTMGSLVLLDPTAGTEGAEPITRLTPEVVFPEIEGWPPAFYANPWPLSERHYLTAWGCAEDVREGLLLDANVMGIYLFDAAGGLELLYRDPDISSECPIPVRPRPAPHSIPDSVPWDAEPEGRFLVADVYRGLATVNRGDIKALRVIAVPAKTHPTMHHPPIGVTRDDPGKCVLGTVPVESDGSAHFRAPAGVSVFFQALDEHGMAVQTMRSATHVMPGRTLGCIGCHEPRSQAPAPAPSAAARREPSRIVPGPDGSWPLRFDRLVQPVLNRHCVSCHNPGGSSEAAAQFDLRPARAYDALVEFGAPSLKESILEGYRLGRSVEGAGLARNSALLALLLDPDGHHDVALEPEELERLVVWMDAYAQRLGSFCDEQEQQLVELRERSAPLLAERPADEGATLAARAD